VLGIPRHAALVRYVAIDDCCQLKCHPYYPTGSENEGEDEMVFEDVGLKVIYAEEKESNVHYMARVFYITDTEVQLLVDSRQRLCCIELNIG